ncbi:hypothetical protein RHSIM_Rhsim05G0027000 [Rhododendron simsii]|uniref:F-box associated beta-propeller type 1 domain-containing protein n=1 Tax=Rhododendron simsii TaxID=118357 RepID=A0A834GYW4_RHOSS|nr:hypothetical protein RHSIM_Rhsim05G0027000 [Rhododendron simsii]
MDVVVDKEKEKEVTMALSIMTLYQEVNFQHQGRVEEDEAVVVEEIIIQTQEDSISNTDCRNSSSRHEPYFYSCHSLRCSETFEECKRLQFPTDIGHFSIKISSCNGVLCLLRCHDLGNSYAIILWNPSINKFKILPKPSGQFETTSPVDYVSVGIGFVPRTNDYKVVRLMSMTRNSDVFSSPQIEIYSLSTDSWTTWTCTYNVQWRLYRKTTDASVNGAVHWTARKPTWCDDDDNGSQLIVSFDLTDEVLREICLPKCHCGRPNRKYGFISVIYEKLAFTVDCGDEDLFYQKFWEIWLLEDYNNNRESWTRFRTITMGPTCMNMVPVQFLNNGEFVVCSETGRLIVFDPKTQQVVAKELRGSGFKVVNYTQSLVLVNEGTDAPSTEMSSFAEELKEFVLGGRKAQFPTLANRFFFNHSIGEKHSIVIAVLKHSNTGVVSVAVVKHSIAVVTPTTRSTDEKQRSTHIPDFLRR